MNVLVEETSLQDIANAIREVTSIDEKIKPSEMGNTQRNFANGLIATANATTGKEDTTLTNAVNSLVEGFGQGGSGDDTNLLKHLIEDNELHFELPDNITKIANCAFMKRKFKDGLLFDMSNITDIGQESFSLTNIISVSLSDKICSVNGHAFYNCKSLTNLFLNVRNLGGFNIFRECSGLVDIEIGNNCNILPYGIFLGCTSLTEITIPNSVTVLGDFVLEKCTSLKKVYLPSSIIEIGKEIFLNDKALEFVTIENGFNANGLDLSPSTLYSVDTIVSWLNALADRTDLEAYTLKIGDNNLMKLTAEQIAIATSKNWTLA